MKNNKKLLEQALIIAKGRLKLAKELIGNVPTDDQEKALVSAKNLIETIEKDIVAIGNDEYKN